MFRKYLQLLLCREVAGKQKKNGLIETVPALFQKSSHDVLNFNSPVSQPAGNGNDFTVPFVIADYLGNICKADEHSGSVRIAKSAFYVKFFKQLTVYLTGFSDG